MAAQAAAGSPAAAGRGRVAARPRQPAPITFLNLGVRKKQGLFEVFKLLIVEFELALEDTVRHPSLTLE